MKRFIPLFVLVSLLLLQTRPTFAKINRIGHLNEPKCNGVVPIIQGQTKILTIFGPWTDWSQDNSGVSGSGVTLTVLERKNSSQNLGGDPSVEIRLQANNNAAPGNRTVTLRYPAGQDQFTLRVIRKANITGANLPTFTQPFQNNVDVRLTGVGLRNVSWVNAIIKHDSFTPLLDAGGQEASGFLTVSAQVNPQTNTDSRADVRLNFSQRLTRATVEITLRSNHPCSGIGPTGVKRTVTLTAPTGGPNYVADHLFDRNNRSYRLGDVVTVTVRLDRPVTQPRVTRASKRFSIRRRLTQQPSGEEVYWTVIPNNAVKQAGSSGTPYNANARNNKVVISPGQQSVAITMQVDRCTAAGQTNTVRFVTWKPDQNNDQPPNRKETSFTINCQQ